jgi:hypothetical protein
MFNHDSPERNIQVVGTRQEGEADNIQQGSVEYRPRKKYSQDVLSWRLQFRKSLDHVLDRDYC